MRALADAQRIRSLMRRLGERCKESAQIYFTGGATAVLQGWRPSTIDVDISIEGASDPVLRAISTLKEELQINIELAAPADFLPELPGWRERSMFIESHGGLAFFHYDPYSQLLAKIERGHAQDVEDVRELIVRGLTDPQKAMELYAKIEPELYRFPAIDPKSFRKSVEKTLSGS